MGLAIVSLRESDSFRVGYGGFLRFRTWLAGYTPLDFQLAYRSWMEAGDMDYQTADRPECEMTADRYWLWQFMSSPDCEGEFHSPDQVAHALEAVRRRIPADADPERLRTLDRIIRIFADSDMVVFS